uniref:Nerve growth factor-related domain-containing protein n=1 Tax=Magallana gigas TaxID=29159 RepID=A0A8W8I3M3_MAGGI
MQRFLPNSPINHTKFPNVEIMHVITTIWITIWTISIMIKAQIEHETSPAQTQANLLRAILWEEREFEEIGKRAYHTLPEHGGLSDCCPVVTHKTDPLGGLSRDGRLLRLYRDPRTIQRFYETSCAAGVLNRPCRYVDSMWRSKCVQSYTYVYAIVQDFNTTQPYRMDYMRIKSGCICKVDDQPSIVDITD